MDNVIFNKYIPDEYFLLNKLPTQTEDFLSDHFKIGPPERPVILIMSPCRSGSTALLQAFCNSHIRGVYQPIKTLLNHASVNSKIKFEDWGTDPICIKETWGPNFEWQVKIDPVEILGNLGCRNISLIFLVRPPAEALFSWIRLYCRDERDLETMLRVFALSYEWQESLVKKAQKYAIDHMLIHYHELNTSETLNKICVRYGLEEHLFDMRQQIVPPIRIASPDIFNDPLEEKRLESYVSTSRPTQIDWNASCMAALEKAQKATVNILTGSASVN